MGAPPSSAFAGWLTPPSDRASRECGQLAQAYAAWQANFEAAPFFRSIEPHDQDHLERFGYRLAPFNKSDNRFGGSAGGMTRGCMDCGSSPQ
jgi:hypothetical protein